MAAESGRDTVKSCVRFRFSSEMFRGISTNVTAGISERFAQGDIRLGWIMMDSELPGTLNVDNFEMRFADISSVEISKLQALSISVGWPHRAADWQHLLDIGKGYVALDEIGRVGASGMWFPHGDGFATFGMLITSPRLQTNGAARWLMKRIMTDCGRNRIRLNSTQEAQRLYASLGFKPKQTVYQYQGTATTPMALPPPEKGLF